MSEILATLAGTFTTCACGAKARDCAFAQMAKFVSDSSPILADHEKPKEPDCLKEKKNGKKAKKVDLGPMVGTKRSTASGLYSSSTCDEPKVKANTISHPPGSDLSQSQIASDRTQVGTTTDISELDPSNVVRPPSLSPHSIARHDGDSHMECSAEVKDYRLEDGVEERLPPRLRKNWIRKAALERDNAISDQPMSPRDNPTSITPSTGTLKVLSLAPGPNPHVFPSQTMLLCLCMHLLHPSRRHQ